MVRRNKIIYNNSLVKTLNTHPTKLHSHTQNRTRKQWQSKSQRQFLLFRDPFYHTASCRILKTALTMILLINIQIAKNSESTASLLRLYDYFKFQAKVCVLLTPILHSNM